MKAEHTWKVKKGVWDKVSFRNLFTTIPKETVGTEEIGATEQ